MLKKAFAVAGIATAIVGAVAPAAFATPYGGGYGHEFEYDADWTNQAGLVNLNDTQVLNNINVCGNDIPIVGINLPVLSPEFTNCQNELENE